ncbi:methyltransferase domain-containing protein [bacterium]|nr:methyltransferase domain-containing protein [bacterium]
MKSFSRIILCQRSYFELILAQVLEQVLMKLLSCVFKLLVKFLLRGLQGKPVLDFGSGSGILSISLALLGAHVDGVEIDPLAIENAKENAQINKVVDHIQWTEDLNALSGRYALLVANILRPVLLEFAPRLVERLENLQNPVILSGLIESDLDSVIQVYSELLKRGPKSILSQGEWRAIVF